MRFLIFLISLVVLGKFLFGMGQEGYQSTVNDTKAKYAVERIQEKLPIKFENGVKIEKAEYFDHTVSLYSTEGWKREISTEQREEFKRVLVQAYCKGKMKTLSEAKLRIDYVFTTQARSLNDLSTDTWKVALQPGDCKEQHRIN
ncbi:hypothetical protein H8L47_10895 [Undibacterium sp. NL8W]|jgi:hypothetical protein|uniref:Uncharacterized protein n=1 Tax=Undibacterium umbellatum TaxID=2762300 RepID=A0ABR6Z8J5_9BURK|nr:hypothetical protein [Undibacterium umbellatum]